MDDDTGVFTISLDTELAWGNFDKDNVERYEEAYRNTPEVIDQLCDLFDEYEIPATWAIVSHLLRDCGEDHSNQTSPDFEWIDDWFAELPCVTEVDKELWYAPWLLDRIQECETEQEIGLHGSTHMQLGSDGCSQQHAKEEIRVAVETLRSHGVNPKTFVYPRNDIGHLDVLREYGIEVYRGKNARWYECGFVPDIMKPLLRFADEAIRTQPPVVEPMEREGLVEVQASQVFRPSHDGWQCTLGESSVVRAKKGLKRAARTGGVFHLWLHPFNLGHKPERDLERFEEILKITASFVEIGAIKCQPCKSLRQ